jgi:hypothetical protein
LLIIGIPELGFVSMASSVPASGGSSSSSGDHEVLEAVAPGDVEGGGLLVVASAAVSEVAG